MRFLVLSTFDVWPPKDGGQTRYCELWRHFPAHHEIVILAYEFRNTEARKTYKLAPNVSVVIPAAAARDADKFHEAAARTGLWLHDLLCIRRYAFSDDFLSCLREEIAEADIVVSAHPYLAHVAFPLAGRAVLKIYESYNVEADIKREYLAGSRDEHLAAAFCSDVTWVETFASEQADIVSAVSIADSERLQQLYGVPAHKLVVVPNGSNAGRLGSARSPMTQEQKAQLGLPDGLVGVFLGSAFAPNVISYRQARALLDAVGFDGSILLIGSIADADRREWPAVGFKEVWLGFVEPEVRDGLLQSADFALQLIFAGAGTNLKLFDYMGAGLPIISNAHGRRGCDDERLWFFEGETPQALRASLEAIAGDAGAAAARGQIAHQIMINQFSWSAIAQGFETKLTRWRTPSEALLAALSP